MLCFGISGHGGCFSSILATLFLFFFCVCLTSTNSSHNQQTQSYYLLLLPGCLMAWPFQLSFSYQLPYQHHSICFAFCLLFYKCQKGHSICKPRQGLKTKLFWLFNKISSFFYKQFEFDFFIPCLHALSYHWMKKGYLLQITSDYAI